MKSILVAIAIVITCMVVLDKESESGREELKNALKNYSIITK